MTVAGVWGERYAARVPHARRKASLQTTLTPGPTTDRPTQDDVEPVEYETLNRVATGIVTVAPVLGLGLVASQLWGSALGYSDLIVFGIMYLATGSASPSASTGC